MNSHGEIFIFIFFLISVYASKNCARLDEENRNIFYILGFSE